MLDIHMSSKSDNVPLKVAVRKRIEKLKGERTKVKNKRKSKEKDSIGKKVTKHRLK